MKKEFRVWHKTRRKFYPLLHLHVETLMNGGEWSTCRGLNCITNSDINIKIESEGIVDQWTGRLDESGKKIFENDIFEVTDGDGWVVGTHTAEIDGETLSLHQDCIGIIVGNTHEGLGHPPGKQLSGTTPDSN